MSSQRCRPDQHSGTCSTGSSTATTRADRALVPRRGRARRSVRRRDRVGDHRSVRPRRWKSDFGTLLSVYVPLHVDARRNFTSRPDAAIRRRVRDLSAVRADRGGDLTTPAAVPRAGDRLRRPLPRLFRLVARASRRLRHQAPRTRLQATHDALTGLPNRRLFSGDVGSLLDQPGDDQFVALVAARPRSLQGDQRHARPPLRRRAAVQVAGRGSQPRCRPSCVARLGGDEFARAARHLRRGTTRSCSRADRARSRSRSTSTASRVSVRASIGLALAPDHGNDVDTLLRHADVAMYVAKRTRSTRRMYSPDFDDYSAERLGLAAELRRRDRRRPDHARATNPSSTSPRARSSASRRSCAGSIPTAACVMPDEFLPIIENTEMIGPLTWHILDLALAQCAEWRHSGVYLGVAVNVSARNLHRLRASSTTCASLSPGTACRATCSSWS